MSQPAAPERPAAPADAAARARPGKYLTFLLGGETHGIEILKVQEIIGMMKTTRVPRTPPFVRGVINLRGKVIPVIDLRRKFELEAREDTERTCIIVVQVARGPDARVTMGVLVDEVSEVLPIGAGQIEPPPDLGAAVDTEFLLGIGKASAKVILLLDVDQILSWSEVADVQKAILPAPEGSG